MRKLIVVMIVACLVGGGIYFNRTADSGSGGIVIGTVYNSDDCSTKDSPVPGVKIIINVGGNDYTALTTNNGSFVMDAGPVVFGNSYNMDFSKNNYQPTTQSITFGTPGLRVDMGDVLLCDLGPIETRNITGRVLDNFSSNGLPGAVVSIVNSNGDPLTATTDADGYFTISGKYIFIGSSYTLTISKNNYVTSNTESVTITGVNNNAGNSLRLYKNYGSITGTITDDHTGANLPGAGVSVVDSQGTTISGTTDVDGFFRLSSNHFYLGDTYTANISKSNYRNDNDSVTINLTGDNPINGSPKPLYISATITGIVKNTPENMAVSGVTVSTTDSGGNPVSTVTNGSGAFTLSSNDFWKNVVYTINFTHSRYETKNQASPATQPGANDMGIIVLTHKLLSGHEITGIVIDYWDNSVKLQAAVEVVDDGGTTRTDTCDANGAFSITGDFRIDFAYNVEFTLSGYTGDNDPAKEFENFVCDTGSPQDLGTIHLYPLGIFCQIGGTRTRFEKDINQTYEKFLTSKTGFTASARKTAIVPGNTADGSTFYVHVDESTIPTVPATSSPSLPEGVQSTLIAINGNSVGGAVNNDIISDNRTNTQRQIRYQSSCAMHYQDYPWYDPRSDYWYKTCDIAETNSPMGPLKMTNAVVYHFKVTDAGNFSITLGGGIPSNLNLYLYNSSGTLQSSSTATPASISNKALSTGWYFIKVVSKNAGNDYGNFTVALTGPDQVSGNTGTYSTNNLILSYYNSSSHSLHIAGNDEAGSSGSITISKMQAVDGLARGTFSCTLRIVTTAGTTTAITNGFFNVIRSE